MAQKFSCDCPFSNDCLCRGLSEVKDGFMVLSQDFFKQAEEVACYIFKPGTAHMLLCKLSSIHTTSSLAAPELVMTVQRVHAATHKHVRLCESFALHNGDPEIRLFWVDDGVVEAQIKDNGGGRDNNNNNNDKIRCLAFNSEDITIVRRHGYNSIFRNVILNRVSTPDSGYGSNSERRTQQHHQGYQNENTEISIADGDDDVMSLDNDLAQIEDSMGDFLNLGASAEDIGFWADVYGDEYLAAHALILPGRPHEDVVEDDSDSDDEDDEDEEEQEQQKADQRPHTFLLDIDTMMLG